MRRQMMKKRRQYHECKAAELDRITDAQKYTKRLARLMAYHKLLSELEAVEVKEVLQSNEPQLAAASTVSRLLSEVKFRVDKTGSMKAVEDFQVVLNVIHEVANGVGSESLISLLAFEYGKQVGLEKNMNQEGDYEK